MQYRTVGDDVRGGMHARGRADDRRDRFGLFAANVDGPDHLANARLDLGPPAGSIEHAVVADTGLYVVEMFVLGNIDAQVMRRLRLAEATNVVVLSLDRHQCRLTDG